MKEIVAPRPKMYSNLTDDDHVDKEAKGKKSDQTRNKISRLQRLPRE